LQALNEPTAALDTESERLVIEALVADHRPPVHRFRHKLRVHSPCLASSLHIRIRCRGNHLVQNLVQGFRHSLILSLRLTLKALVIP
jgi:hypothetical protein